MSHCTVYAITNQKGGVGKTTTTVNLGIGLAKAGNKVLLIDFDPQASLTASLGYKQPDELDDTISTVLEHNETTAVKISVAGATNHTPVIPQRAGNMNVNANRRTTPLRDDMIAELNASPQPVKYIEFITSKPITKNVAA